MKPKWEVRFASFMLRAVVVIAMQCVCEATYSIVLPPAPNRVISEFDEGVLVEYFPNDTDVCDSWILFPAQNMWHRALRALLYFLFLCYLFVGIAIVSDVFMNSIEMITSEETTSVIDTETGNEVHVRSSIWNPTVANLTLLALGSSAPEIMLSVIETVTKLDSKPGELGPATIVGSAAFNLLVISAICVSAVEKPKKIEEFGVFVITALFSLFAYIWMVVVLSIWTECEISLPEALITLAFFPLLVFVAYMQDKGWCFGSTEEATSPRSSRRDTLTDLSALQRTNSQGSRRASKILTTDLSSVQGVSGGRADLHDSNVRADIMNIWRGLKGDPDGNSHEMVSALKRVTAPKSLVKKRPSLVMKTTGLSMDGKLEELQRICPNSEEQAMGVDRDSSFQTNPKSNVSFRQKAPGGNPLKCAADDICDNTEVVQSPRTTQVTVLEWATDSFTIIPGAAYVDITMVRHGDTTKTVTAKYETINGTARAGEDYEAMSGHIIIEAYAHSSTLRLPILNQSANTEFSVCLLSAGGGAILGKILTGKISISSAIMPCLGFVQCFSPGVTKDEDDEDYGDGSLRLKVHEGFQILVSRTGSLQSSVSFTVATHQGAAVDGIDYRGINERVTIEEGCASALLTLEILDTSSLQKNVDFVMLLGACSCEVSTQKAVIVICEDPNVTLFLEKLGSLLNQDDKIHSDTFCAQFESAFVVQGDSGIAYALHFVALCWKVLCACIPPVTIWKGKATFVVALAFIGVITAIVAEVANLFGCALGLRPSVTAITFVALGTSLPDTFASKVTAEEDDFADSAVGNVTGSNCVNVFLGLGLPWVIAALYKTAQGEVYTIPAGDLVYSVVLYVCCAVLGLGLLVANRYVYGGELGGPRRHLVSLCLILLWLLYVTMSSMKVYGHLGSSESSC